MDKIFEHKPCLDIHALFELAAKSANHEKLIKSLFSIYENNSKSTFIIEFLQCLAVAWTYMEKHPPVEHTLDFAAKYCTWQSSTLKEDDILQLAVFEFIFDNHSRKLHAIRFRSCEFVNRLLNKMGAQASLDDDIFHKIASTMLERLQDKMPSIRAQAVMALQRLQDPPNKDCRIIKAFLYHMENDPSCEVRARVVQSIAVTQRTLPCILERLRDLKESVRKETYRSLIRLKPRKFSIKQRQYILNSGFSDKSDNVKNFVLGRLLPTWFEACGKNLIEFLSMLDLATLKTETFSAVMKHLFETIPRTELVAVVVRLQSGSSGNKVIPLNDLNPESAALWAVTVSYIGFEEAESVILPELTHFAKYIMSFSNEVDLTDPDAQYMLQQLVDIAKSYSTTDEMGRKTLIQTCVDIMKTDRTYVEVIPSLTKLLELLVPIVKERMVLMAELISDIREPLEVDHGDKVDDIDWEAQASPKKDENVQIEKDENTQTDSVDELNAGLSQLNCGSSLDDCSRAERTDPPTLIKCLTIIREMLKSPSVNKIDATLFTLKQHFIVNCFKSTDGRVLSLVCDCLSLLCIRSLDLAKEYFFHFCMQITNDSTCVSAIEAVFDILLEHGIEPFSVECAVDNNTPNGVGGISEFFGEGSALDFNNDPTFTPATRNIIPLLTGLLKSNVKEVKHKVCEGLSKLLLSSRINSPIALANLIVLWFSPETDSEPLIRQPLGLFFSIFSSRREGAPEIILAAFSPTLRRLEELHNEEIDQGKVANLFVTLLRTDIASKIGKPEGRSGSYHSKLAFIVLDELRQEMIPAQVLAKTLSSLQLDESDGEIADRLLVQALRTQKWISKRSGERRIINIVKKFKDEVDKIKNNYLLKKEMEETTDIKEETVKSIKDESVSVCFSPKENTTEKPNESAVKRKGAVKKSIQTKKVKSKEDDKDITMDSVNTTECESLSVIETEKTEIAFVDESTVMESDDEKRLSSLEPNGSSSTVEPSENDSQNEEKTSEDIFTPSPPKRRMLRSRKK